MIKSITMKNAGSYKEETKLYLNTPITLIYGNNGAGKTLLSNYLYDINNDIYKECSIDGLDTINDNILVYNQKFIEENFYVNKQQKGIFTLSKENKEINEKIEKLEEILLIKNKEKTLIEQDKTVLDNELETNIKNIREDIYQFKKTYANNSNNVFKDFFNGIHMKDEFLDYILNLNIMEDNSTVEELEKQLKTLTNYKEIDLVNINEISNILDTLNNIESNKIFNEIIVGSDNAVYSPVINMLDNLEWVEKGYKEYLPKSNDVCPFCQQKINSKELILNLEQVINNSYKDKKNNLIDLYNKYKDTYNHLNNFINNLYSNTYIDKIEPSMIQNIKNIYYAIKYIIDNNIDSINKKLNKMSLTFTLNKSDNKLNDLITLLKAINSKIEEHNVKVNNTKDEKEKIKDKFFNICRKQYDMEIRKFYSEQRTIEKKIEITKQNENNNEEAIKECFEKLKEYHTQTQNAFTSLENINNLLQEMGILNFKLEKVDNNFYKIIRDNEEADIFRTLSEGEKMIISFLYFIEKCNGIINDDEVNRNKLIVIDDPISSLSFEHIFTIASIIKHSVIEELINKTNNKIIILTHNLYFFHEFYLLDRHDKQYLNQIYSYRIFKNNNLDSRFEKIHQDDLLNDYQSLWKILKDFKQNKCSAIILPNTMRNILEYFSAFIHNKSYIKILEKNENKIFNQTFCRYINRHSHNDKYNISFYKEYSPDIFMDNFKKLFEIWGYNEHYNSMMGIKNEVNN